MKKYLLRVKELAAQFKHFAVKKVSREKNEEAYELARLGSALEDDI
jgi:hypothetical protein